MLPQGFGELLKQAQAMQQQFAGLHEALRQKIVEATAGGGMVTVRVNGRQEVVSIQIDPSVLATHDATMVQDLILAATNEALRRSRDMVGEAFKNLTGGLSIPGLF